MENYLKSVSFLGFDALEWLCARNDIIGVNRLSKLVIKRNYILHSRTGIVSTSWAMLVFFAAPSTFGTFPLQPRKSRKPRRQRCSVVCRDSSIVFRNSLQYSELRKEYVVCSHEPLTSGWKSIRWRMIRMQTKIEPIKFDLCVINRIVCSRILRNSSQSPLLARK